MDRSPQIIINLAEGARASVHIGDRIVSDATGKVTISTVPPGPKRSRLLGLSGFVRRAVSLLALWLFASPQPPAN